MEKKAVLLSSCRDKANTSYGRQRFLPTGKHGGRDSIRSKVFEGDGATLVGFTSSEGYTFERSRALRGDRWCGLVVDLDNQSEQAEKRIREWCEQVKKEFE